MTRELRLILISGVEAHFNGDKLDLLLQTSFIKTQIPPPPRGLDRMSQPRVSPCLTAIHGGQAGSVRSDS